MMCNNQCGECGACLMESPGDDARYMCPRCRTTYGGDD